MFVWGVKNNILGDIIILGEMLLPQHFHMSQLTPNSMQQVIIGGYKIDVSIRPKLESPTAYQIRFFFFFFFWWNYCKYVINVVAFLLFVDKKLLWFSSQCVQHFFYDVTIG